MKMMMMMMMMMMVPVKTYYDSYVIYEDRQKIPDAKYVYTYSIFFPHPMAGGMPLSSSMAGFCLTYS